MYYVFVGWKGIVHTIPLVKYQYIHILYKTTKKRRPTNNGQNAFIALFACILKIKHFTFSNNTKKITFLTYITHNVNMRLTSFPLVTGPI